MRKKAISEDNKREMRSFIYEQKGKVGVKIEVKYSLKDDYKHGGITEINGIEKGNKLITFYDKNGIGEAYNIYDEVSKIQNFTDKVALEYFTDYVNDGSINLRNFV